MTKKTNMEGATHDKEYAGYTNYGDDYIEAGYTLGGLLYTEETTKGETLGGEDCTRRRLRGREYTMKGLHMKIHYSQKRLHGQGAFAFSLLRTTCCGRLEHNLAALKVSSDY